MAGSALLKMRSVLVHLQVAWSMLAVICSREPLDNIEASPLGMSRSQWDQDELMAAARYSRASLGESAD
jgi:hypothetical protein